MKKKPESGDAAPPDASEVRARALALLARREHSLRELQRKLQQRDYPADLVVPVLQDLLAEGLLSETRYADEWLRSRVARGQGPNKIRAELRQRGLSDEQIGRALADAAANWGQLATEARRKRFGSSLPATRLEWSRQARFLESRGFAAEHIRQALGDDED